MGGSVDAAADRFVRTVVEPLAGDAEVYALAHSELGERVEEAGSTGEGLETATLLDAPVLYADSLAQHSFGRGLPSDLLETAGRIDPDNAHFLLLAAGGVANGAVEGKHRPGVPSRSNRSMLRDWKINDEAAVRETPMGGP